MLGLAKSGNLVVVPGSSAASGDDEPVLNLPLDSLDYSRAHKMNWERDRLSGDHFDGIRKARNIAHDWRIGELLNAETNNATELNNEAVGDGQEFVAAGTIEKNNRLAMAD